MNRHLSTAVAYGLIAWRRVQQAAQARRDRTLPYFWRDRPCPRCLATGAKATACSQTIAYSDGLFFDMHPTVPEGPHIHRACGGCEHRWIELASTTPRLSVAGREAEISRLHRQLREARDDLAAARKATA